ncbi:zinc finger protein [Holotrichia oblita]|uniref:Zinc finger protein n=1 Tax=Holotrichia oblita TaxID=644536 RepID=A0ACB9SJ09_HOLOL|nr:zinc finger protein [Holotrichia oblita]
MFDVCRLCLSDIQEIANKLSYDDYTSYNNKIKLIMPEIDITTTTTFVLCEQCSESLNSAYDFKCRCLEIEKLIINYLKETFYDCQDDLSGIQHFVDVEAVCNETDEKNQLKLDEESNKIEVCETEIYREPIKKKEAENFSKTFKCDICNKILLNRFLLARHQLVHGGRHFICDICKKGFKTKYDLKRHEKTHTTAKMYKCPTCFKLVRDVKRHIESSHVYKHICDVCGAKFAYNSTLIDHIRIHTGDRPFRCEMCGRGFAQKSTLDIHIKSVHTKEKRHVCEICGKGFTTPAELRKHGLVHVANPERKFVCEVAGCNKAFPTKQRRHDHMKRHSTEKKYKCTICDKAFFDNHGLKRHIKIHTGEKPFECSICNKTFGQKTNMFDVCRLCLSDIPEIINKLSYDDYTSYDTKIKLIMPEIDITTTTTFVLCKHCSESLNSAYDFKCKCLEVEKLIFNYMKEKNATVINLKRLKDKTSTNNLSLNESPIKIDEIYENCRNDEELEIKNFCDVNVICNDNFYNEDLNQPELDECTDQIEVHESKTYCEPIKKPEIKSRSSKTKSFRYDLSNQKFLDRFILTPHKFGRHFTCEICNKGFRRRFDLKRHKVTHTNVEMSECSICFKLVTDVKRHMKTHFSQHICDICGSKFAWKCNLIKHIRIHTGDRPYTCEMCGKSFTQKSTLDIHIKSIHTGEKRHICENCGKKFTTSAELRKHSGVHIPNSEKKFVCEINGCDKAFVTKQRRHDHMKRHNPDKKHKCTICHKGFFSGQSLRRHHIIHTGEKPFECDTCHKRFNRKSNLQIHFKSHQPKVT